MTSNYGNAHVNDLFSHPPSLYGAYLFCINRTTQLTTDEQGAIFDEQLLEVTQDLEDFFKKQLHERNNRTSAACTCR